MAAAAADVAALERVREIAAKLPGGIEGQARQLVALRWLAFDPVKAVEMSFDHDEFLDHWAASDLVAVMEYAKKPGCPFCSESWQAGMKHLVKKDPQAAWRLYAEAPEGWKQDDDAIDITAAIASLNPAEFAARLPGEGMPGRGYFTDLGAAKAWLRQDPAAGFAWIAQNTTIHDGSDLLVLFEEVSLDAWPEALTVLKSLDAARRDRLVEMIGSSLDCEHPHELIEMMDAAGVELGVGNGARWLFDALESLATKDPAAAAAMLPRLAPEAYAEAVKRIAGELYRQSPEGAKAWVQSLVDSPVKGAELEWIERSEQPPLPTAPPRTEEQTILSNWSYISFNAPVPDIVLKDPAILDRLATTVSQIENPAEREVVGSRVLNAIKAGDSEMILDVLRRFPVQENQFAMNAGHFFYAWSQVNPDAAASAAESLPEPARSYARKAMAGK